MCIRDRANFVASLNKMAVDQAKKRYPEMEVPNERPFTCLSFARKSFVYFPDLKEVRLKSIAGKEILITTLTREQALAACKVMVGKEEKLLITSADVLQEDAKVRIQSTDTILKAVDTGKYRTDGQRNRSGFPKRNPERFYVDHDCKQG